ncbi:MAG: ribonuclease J, partial [Oscillospiraceae bacterium]
GEVGKNITLYECQGDMILVDCGLVFPDSDMFGIDLVIPDFAYVIQNKDRIRGIVITHGHEDHIGALPYLLKEYNFPIYATRLTLGLIGNKLEEHGLKAGAALNEIEPKKKFKLGCFSIEPIHVNHSIPDAVALAITCPAGVILQTGDFKIDYTPIQGGATDLATIAEYGKNGVLALLSDSTNSERAGFTATEQKVGESFARLFDRAEKKRIIIATFASNLYRVQQIIDIAVASGRKVAVSGRSMVNNTQMAMELGYLHAPEGVLIDIETINRYLPEQVVLITTGSQGEPLSALSRMSGGSHRNVHVGVGDFIIISANPIPGNEKMVTKVINALLKLGAEVIYESMYDVHVSGHACQEEQKLIISLSKPQYFLPVHGEYKQLKRHAMTALAMGVPDKNIYIGENGDNIILSRDSLTMGEGVTAGAVMVDGLGVGDVGNVVLRDRRHLSQDGLVIIVATVDSATGELLAGPDIVSRGFVYVREADELIGGARDIVRDVLDKCRGEHVREWGNVKMRVREAVSAYMYRRTKRSPMILPVLMEV